MQVFITGVDGFIRNKLFLYFAKIGVGIHVFSRKPYYNYEAIICDFEKEEIPLSGMSPAVRYNISKLLGDECYYSEKLYYIEKLHYSKKLQSFGFKA